MDGDVAFPPSKAMCEKFIRRDHTQPASLGQVMMMMVVVILGQTVRLLPIIGEADKETSYPSPGSTPTLLA